MFFFFPVASSEMCMNWAAVRTVCFLMMCWADVAMETTSMSRQGIDGDGEGEINNLLHNVSSMLWMLAPLVFSTY